MDQNEKETIATDIKEKTCQINDNEGHLICGFVWNLAVLNLKLDQNEKEMTEAVIKEKTRQINAMNDIYKL